MGNPIMGNDEADRWFQAYLELQEKRKRQGRTSGGTRADALESLSQRLAGMDVQVYGRTVRQQRREELAAEIRRKRDLYRAGIVSKSDFEEAVYGEFVPEEPPEEPPEEDTRTATYTGRRPAPAIARTPVVTFTRYEATRSALVKEDYITMTDIDGTEVYVATEAVQRRVASGEVPGYSALTPEEADHLHLVLVEAEHFQRSIMRQALVEEATDPESVLRTAKAHGAQANYRRRLHLPKHDYSLECCGEDLAPLVREEVTQ